MAVISVVKICNMALSHIGTKSTIEDITENSPEAKRCNLWYDFSRLQTLEAFDWSFARKRLDLALHSDAAPDDGQWCFRYQYPSDCVRFRKIQNPLGESADAVPYEIELSVDNQTRSILSNSEDAVGVYTMDLVQTNLFSPLFIEAFSYALASHICMSLSGKTSLRREIIETFKETIRAAPASNANEQMGEPPRDAEWIRDR